MTTLPCYNQSQVQFHHPFTCIASGSTGAGKTFFLLKLIAERHDLIKPTPIRVIYSYKRYQKVFDQLIQHGVEVVLKQNYKLNPDVPTLLIIDDQMEDGGTVDIAQLFTVDSHHCNCSVIFVMHNLFHQTQKYRTAALNSHYFILFKSPRGPSQIAHLARQLYGGGGHKVRRMVEAYTDATAKPYGYLLVDLHPLTPEALRLRTDILRDQGETFGGQHLSLCYSF